MIRDPPALKERRLMRADGRGCADGVMEAGGGGGELEVRRAATGDE